MQYCLINDDSGHWYLCPADRKREGQIALDEMERYWSEGDYSRPEPEEPDYLVRIPGHISMVVFEQPEIDGEGIG